MTNSDFIRTNRQELFSRIFGALFALLGIGIILSTIFYMVKWYSPLPIFDQWGNIHEKMTLDLLFKQHNVHRIVFPRLFFMLDDFFGGKQIVNLTVNVLLAFSTVFFSWKIFFQTNPDKSLGLKLIVCGLFACLAFSSVQYVNFSWGFQLQFLGVYAVAIFACYSALQAVRGETLDKWAVFRVCLAMIVCAFCMFNGIVLGVFILAFFFVAYAHKGKRQNWMLLGGIGLLMIILMALYFHDLKSVGSRASPLENLKDPVRLARFYMTVLGSAFGLKFAPFAGAAMISGALYGFYLALRKRTNLNQLAFLTIIAFIGASCFLIAFGRSDSPFFAAATSRYTTPSVILMIALFGFYLSNFSFTGKFKAWSVLSVGLLVAIFLAAQQFASESGYYDRWERRQLATAALINNTKRISVLKSIHPSIRVVSERVDILKAKGYSIFGLEISSALGTKLSEWSGGNLTRDCSGIIENVERVSERRQVPYLTVSGWALYNQGIPDAVFLVDENSNIFGIGMTGFARENNYSTNRLNWFAFLPLSKDKPMTAYAYKKGQGVCMLAPLRQNK